MKAVALHTERCDLTRESNGLGNGWLRPVKGGIETGHLWNRGFEPGDRPDRREVLWLMQWSQQDELLQLSEQFRIHKRGC